MAQDLAATGHHLTQASLLSRDRMESMGKDLIQLCDQLEQYGLVDYQMGIWEEEILCGELCILICYISRLTSHYSSWSMPRYYG